MKALQVPWFATMRCRLPRSVRRQVADRWIEAKEMGVILATAVALDALVLRLVVLPVVLRLGGHSAWRQPRWLGRILPKVQFLH